MKGMQLLTLTQDACVGLIPRSFAHGERTVGAALPRVGGSIPPLATIHSNCLHVQTPASHNAFKRERH